MGSFAAVAVVLAVTAKSAWAAIPLVVLLGAAEFSVTPAVNARVFSILGETRTLGGAVNIAPIISGLVINTVLGLAGTGRRHQTTTLEAGLLTAALNTQRATAATH
ncbi:hypothetical protein [Streptomyces mirabilis]